MATPIVHLSETTPRLLVVVHTEEEFDWSAGFARDKLGTTHTQALPVMHEICAAKGYKPTYFCSYPIANSTGGSSVLRAMVSDGSGQIGAHLHPWVCPPFSEEVSSFNSYPGNLPEAVERKKLSLLTERIAEAFGNAPTAYLAGRYGFGANTGQILGDLGYRVDCSSAPGWDYRADGGPNYRDESSHAFWDAQSPSLLRIPHTGGYVGRLCQGGNRKLRIEDIPLAKKLRLPGIASRLGLVTRTRLTLEGSDPAAMRQLARDLFDDGVRLFTLSYHSPSADIGHTPYVQTAADLASFKTILREFLDFFTPELGGTGATANEAYALACKHVGLTR
jgi:hypothetical protein